MMISILKLKPDPAQQNTILDILRFSGEQVRQKRGCLKCDTYKGCDETGAILYLEFWKSKEELHEHIQSNLYRYLMNAMDLCIEKPEVLFYEITAGKGMELVKRLRLQKSKKKGTGNN